MPCLSGEWPVWDSSLQDADGVSDGGGGLEGQTSELES